LFIQEETISKPKKQQLVQLMYLF